MYLFCVKIVYWYDNILTRFMVMMLFTNPQNSTLYTMPQSGLYISPRGLGILFLEGSKRELIGNSCCGEGQGEPVKSHLLTEIQVLTKQILTTIQPGPHLQADIFFNSNNLKVSEFLKELFKIMSKSMENFLKFCILSDMSDLWGTNSFLTTV